MGKHKVVPEFKQPITDRKLRVMKVLVGASAGYYSPPQVGQMGEVIHFLGREINSYTKEEFEEVIKPFEERIKDAGQTK